MKKYTRSLLEELDSISLDRDREQIIENRGTHIITSAINLINQIRENYDEATAGELERRFLNAIRGQDVKKFTRGTRKLNG